MTTSSPKTFTNKLAKKGMHYISDQDVIREYGLPDHLRGKELDKAAEKEQDRRNKTFAKNKGTLK